MQRWNLASVICFLLWITICLDVVFFIIKQFQLTLIPTEHTTGLLRIVFVGRSTSSTAHQSLYARLGPSDWWMTGAPSKGQWNRRMKASMLDTTWFSSIWHARIFEWLMSWISTAKVSSRYFLTDIIAFCSATLGWRISPKKNSRYSLVWTAQASSLWR